jgi:hypothetical protein
LRSPIDPVTVAQVTSKLFDMGCYEVSLGDTIGAGTPGSFARMLDKTLEVAPAVDQLAVHCHDTYGRRTFLSVQLRMRLFSTSLTGFCTLLDGALLHGAIALVVVSRGYARRESIHENQLSQRVFEF